MEYNFEHLVRLDNKDGKAVGVVGFCSKRSRTLWNLPYTFLSENERVARCGQEQHTSEHAARTSNQAMDMINV